MLLIFRTPSQFRSPRVSFLLRRLLREQSLIKRDRKVISVFSFHTDPIRQINVILVFAERNLNPANLR